MPSFILLLNLINLVDIFDIHDILDNNALEWYIVDKFANHAPVYTIDKLDKHLTDILDNDTLGLYTW